jgi:REP element-mobilizing transposase RayT
VREALAAASQKLRFRIIHYSIQGNHLHLIAEGDDTYAVSRAMRGLSIRIAKRLNQLMKRSGQVIEERYFMSVLKTPLAVFQATRYVLNNYRKHAAEWGERLSRDFIDPCSSARWFSHWTCVPAPARDPCPDLDPAIVEPLSAVWREVWTKYGSIEPWFVPSAPRSI